jgi:tRNA1(Val) A37 N6-methylase TrmN6
MIDVFYTPLNLAKLMISNVKQRKPKSIADFAAGDAELLEAAYNRWKHTQFIATDLDKKSVRRLKIRYPKWSISTCDFLKEKSRNQCYALRNNCGKISLVLLNPPFSYRGGAHYKVEFDGEVLSCSKAMAFVTTSIQYMKPDGELLAILPSGTMHTEKDNNIWRLLNNKFEICVISNQDAYTFPECKAKTILIRLSKQKNISFASNELHNDRNIKKRKNSVVGIVKIIRGVVQMHTLNGHNSQKKLPLIHTTDLVDNSLQVTHRQTVQNRRILKGPAILIPRVGEPKIDKICLYLSRKPIVLSDCIFGLECSSPKSAFALKELLKKNWTLLQNTYGGTCAKYTTLSSLSRVFDILGIQYVHTGLNKS